jgi:hypothetical protein
VAGDVPGDVPGAPEVPHWYHDMPGVPRPSISSLQVFLRDGVRPAGPHVNGDAYTSTDGRWIGDTRALSDGMRRPSAI